MFFYVASPRDHHHDSAAADHDTSFDHEAILGSKKDAESFNELSPEEAKARLEVLLEKMDRNLDKNVDRYVHLVNSFFRLCVCFLCNHPKLQVSHERRPIAEIIFEFDISPY